MTFNDFIAKVGQDKVMHFLSGGVITAFITLILALQEGEIGWFTLGFTVVGFVVTLFFALFKELVIDITFDKKDLVATLLGTLPIFLATFLGVLFNTLS